MSKVPTSTHSLAAVVIFRSHIRPPGWGHFGSCHSTILLDDKDVINRNIETRMRRRGFPRIRRFDDAQLGEKAPFILTDSGDFDTKTQD
jgi:hypothetical protein